MSRRKKTEGLEETLVPEVEQEPVQAERVTLRLKQNDFVRGAFARGGSLHTFTPEEADRRLRTTKLWEHA